MATDSADALDRRSMAKAVVGFTIAIVLLYFLGSAVGWGDILDALARADLRWVAIACLSTCGYLLAWTKTWQVVLDAGGISIPYRELVPTYLAATFANYTTPFGQAGGEPFIAYVLSADTHASYEESLASVSTADLLNLLPFFTFAGVGLAALAITGTVPPGARSILVGLAAIAIGVPALVYGAWRRRDLVENILTTLARPVTKRTDRIAMARVEARIDSFYDQLARIADEPRDLLVGLVYSYLGWVFFAAPLYFAALALGLPVDPLLVAFLVPASSLAGFVPTPGGLGGVSTALVALVVALTPVGAGPAAALALLYRATSYVFALAVCGPTALYVTARA
ncbi:lysylphosphatidylglycerol synthase transmembrane domain-containing protein [Halococcus sediminicola]|uniref:lysylphosphatidylglycerol synthase transmembrane domain-containing protein n=1 Tax=Halococcus sediminicola TaxID=1264579 RepID=UPI0006789CD3|nr:lysylphosphatidylglycerol synthase transmembrane domain-containing protein [Halococcus sediminicola]